MNLIGKFRQFFKISAITLVFSLFLLSQSAIALLGMPSVDRMFDVPITGGEFSVDVPNIEIPESLRVGSAILSLPEGETGTIEEIIITGPDGERQFGCVNVKVQNGTDLIKSCGGPAYLKAGKTTYKAKGSNFKPQGDVELSVDLSV